MDSEHMSQDAETTMDMRSLLLDAEDRDRQDSAGSGELYTPATSTTSERRRIFVLSFPMVRPGSIKGSIFNLTNSITGACILAIPYVFKTCGVVGGALLVGTCSLFAYLSALVLMITSHQESKRSYKDLAVHAFGRHMRVIVDLNIAIVCFGTCVGYCKLFGGIVTAVFHNFGLHGLWVNVDFVMAVFTILFVFPLALIRNINALRYTSLLSILALLYLVLTVVVKFGMAVADNPPAVLEKIHWVRFNGEVLNIIPVGLFAFTCHLNVFAVYQELHNPLLRRIRKVMRRSIIFTVIMYEAIGIAGYIIFMDDTLDNVMDSFQGRQGVDVAVNIGRLALVTCITFSFPLMSHPCRSSLENVFFDKRPASTVRSFILTVLIVLVSLGTAWGVPNIKIVFGIVGASSGTFICYVLPGLFYLKLVDSKWCSFLKIVSLLLVVVAGGLGVTCTTKILYDWITIGN